MNCGARQPPCTRETYFKAQIIGKRENSNPTNVLGPCQDAVLRRNHDSQVRAGLQLSNLLRMVR